MKFGIYTALPETTNLEYQVQFKFNFEIGRNIKIIKFLNESLVHITTKNVVFNFDSNLIGGEALQYKIF